MTFEEFVLSVADVERPSHIRVGQHAFNMLFDVKPKLAEKIRGTDYDPFYFDTKLDKFWEFVGENWDA